MKYELAKELKDNGFPQSNKSVFKTDDGFISKPTYSEVLEELPDNITFNDKLYVYKLLQFKGGRKVFEGGIADHACDTKSGEKFDCVYVDTEAQPSPDFLYVESGDELADNAARLWLALIINSKDV